MPGREKKLKISVNEVTAENESESGQANPIKIESVSSEMKKRQITIGKNIRTERKKRKLSIEDLAISAKISPAFVGLIERGDRCPSLKNLYVLCDLFHVTPDALLLDTKGRRLRAAEPPPEIAAIYTLLNGLDNDELEVIKNLLLSLHNMRSKKAGVKQSESVEYGKNNSQYKQL